MSLSAKSSLEAELCEVKVQLDKMTDCKQQFEQQNQQINSELTMQQVITAMRYLLLLVSVFFSFLHYVVYT